MAQSGEDVRALLERVAAEAGELHVTPFEVERRIRARRSTRFATGAAGVVVAAAAVGLGVGVMRPGPSGLNEPGGSGTSGTSSTAAGGAHLVECGKTLLPPLTTIGPRGARLSVVKVVRSAATGTAEVTVQVAATSAAQFSASGLTPLQVLLVREGHVVDRLSSYAFRPGEPVVDALAEGAAGQGGTGPIGHTLTVTPNAPWTTQVTGPGHCPGADWATVWRGAPGYSLVAVMSLPGSPEKPGLIVAGDPLLTSTPHPVSTG